MAYEPDTAIGGPRHQFPTTRYSLFQAAADQDHGGREALDGIIAIYWKPAYKHVRLQWKRSNEEAKDLVQGFFAMLVEQEVLTKFDPAQGRLRTFLRTCLDRFVMNQDQAATRLKRGGGVTFDFEAAEQEIRATAPSPEDVFFREWEREMFVLAIEDFRAYCNTTGKMVQYRLFEQYDLTHESRPNYADLANEHQLSVTTVTNFLAWARRELRRCLRTRLDRS